MSNCELASDPSPNETIRISLVLPHIFACEALVQILLEENPAWFVHCRVVRDLCKVLIWVARDNPEQSGLSGLDVIYLRAEPETYLRELAWSKRFFVRVTDLIRATSEVAAVSQMMDDSLFEDFAEYKWHISEGVLDVLTRSFAPNSGYESETFEEDGL